MTLTFTEAGLLTPAAGIETSLATIEEHFVHAFPNSGTRSRIFENYQRYLNRFQDEIFPWFEQWVDGSFVTMKENPKDIDVVTFLNWQVVELRQKKLEEFWSYNLENEGIDAYIVAVYPNDHPDYNDFLRLRKKYESLFGSDRRNIPKGYLILKLERNIE